MTPLSVAVLFLSLLTLAGLVVAVGVGGLCLYSLRTMRPQVELRVAVLALEAKVDFLEQQVTKLRTKKAGATSARRKEEAEESEIEGMAGLTPEEAALFQ